jgi:rare lipoprotein A
VSPVSARKLGMLALVTAALLAGCAREVRKTDVEQGTWQRSRDGAPSMLIHPDQVPDATPRPDPLLAAGNTSPYVVNGVRYQVLEDFRGYSETGVASWYGTKFHGRPTSNGERYDLFAPTAAHRSLPIPTFVRVTNLENGLSMIVRVNDRGPFHSDRLIDLSYGAAVRLGFAEQGTARVRVELLDIAGVDDRRRDPVGGDYRYLQLGAFSNESTARRLGDEISAQFYAPVAVSPVATGGGMLYRVRLGPVSDRNELARIRRELEQRGYGQAQPLP